MKSCWLNKLATTICSLALLHAASADAFIASIKNFGMGGAGVAYPQDALTAVYNPAGGVHIPNRVDVGVSWLHQSPRATVNGSVGVLPGPIAVPGLFDGAYISRKGRDILSPEFGINYHWCGVCDVAVGLVAYNKNYLQVHYNRPFLVLSTTTPLKMQYINETVAPYVSLMFDCHAIGVSANVHIQRLTIDGLENFDSALVSASPGSVTNRGADYSSGLGWTFGYIGEWFPGVTVGATWEPKTKMRSFDRYKGFIGQQGHIDIPERWTLGLALEFTPCIHLIGDVQYIRWSKIFSLANSAVTDTLQLITNKLGSQNGPGFGWRDQTIIRIGADYIINPSWTIRAGYRWGKTPIRRRFTLVNIITQETVENFVMVGLSYRPCANTELSAYYAYGFPNTIRGNQAIALAGGTQGSTGLADLRNEKQAVGISYGQTW